MSTRTAEPIERREARCVLWSLSEPPTALVEAMRRRGIEPRESRNAFEAMAEVTAGGSMERTGCIVVLVEPSTLRGKRAMLTSCRRYAPGLRVWVYQAEAPVQLRPLELTQLVSEPEPDAAHTFGSDPEARPAGGVPPLRLVETGSTESASSVNQVSEDADNPDEERPSGLLTDEELAMLLADDPAGRKKR